MFRMTPAGPDDVQRAARLSRVRGLLLGLALGDALTRGEPSDRGVLRATVTTQLACFTAEGLIRTWVRAEHRGIGPALGLVWNAYRRWAMIQGIDLGDGIELNGWLCEVPALAEPRGDAPAVVTALRTAAGPVVADAPATSRGHHALTRLLPAAAVPWLQDEHAHELASMTHGSATAVEASTVGIALGRAALTVPSLPEAIDQLGRTVLLDGILDPDVALKDLGRSHSARSALRGGVAVVARCPDGSPAAVRSAFREVRRTVVPAAVGPVAGALLGALHGSTRGPTWIGWRGGAGVPIGAVCSYCPPAQGRRTRHRSQCASSRPGCL